MKCRIILYKTHSNYVHLMMHGQQSAGTRLAVSQFLGPMAIAEGEAGRTGVKVPDLQLGGCPLETKNKREQMEGGSPEGQANRFSEVRHQNCST